jgi:ubiquitin C-terminal hydrolase
LQECLQEYLKEEILDGCNQYFCSTCQQKRDAKRFTELQSLPSVLNFQLMRFVIDWESETFRKKKLKNLIKFPISINMASFYSEGANMYAEWYDLKAVLLHRGDSAYSGHYIAHLWDVRYVWSLHFIN